MNGHLTFFFYQSHAAHTYVGFHKHACYEFVYYVTGKGTLQLDGQTLSYAPGTMAVIQPYFLHDEQHDEATEVIFFGLAYDDIPVTLRNGLIEDTADREMLQLIHTMKAELIAQKPHYATRVNLLLNEVILLTGRAAANAETNGFSPWKLQYALQFIDEHFTQAVNLRTLAELSGYSDDHFRHLFKSFTGLPPARYIIRKRLDNAVELLRQSSLSVSEIGAECGFSTTSQFIDMFKRAHGTTPLQFRTARAPY